MPDKSRRRKGKYAYQAKRREKTGSPAQVVQSSTATETRETAPVPRVAPVAPIRKSAAAVKQVLPRNLHVGRELRTIGILASALLILLVVLARIIA